MSTEPAAVAVVILAAGRGTRMRSKLPKVLQPLAGRPLLRHVLNQAQALSAAQTIVVYGHGGEAVHAAFADDAVAWAEQREQRGTGHAVQQALPHLKAAARVLVLCGDVPLLRPTTLQRLLDETADDAVGVLTVELPDSTGYGRIVRDEAGHVRRIVEEKDASDEERRITEINTGVFVLPASRLPVWLGALTPQNQQNELYLTDVVSMAVADGVPVTAVMGDDADEVMGINDRRQLAMAERAWQLRAAEDLMQAGARLADPSRVDIRGTVDVGQDVFIDVNVVFSGDVRLGDDCVIGANCVISDATIGEGTIVQPHTTIEDSDVGVGCALGPYARLRPGAVLKAGAKAGNFVEIKKSVIGEGSKVNHLTYIGDAEIGRDVNVGAGTITCNYDGANKHRTVIGDGAFIGSGVELVAPVDIGAGATIGAGSTVTRGAPADALTLERARQRTIDGWQRPVKKK